MHPLDGARFRMARSKDKLDYLNAEIDKFMESEPYKLARPHFDPKTQEGTYSVIVQSDPDPAWSVIIGEIAHNLRATLDGLVWQLALLKTREPYYRTVFPICRVGYGRRKRPTASGRYWQTFWQRRRGKLVPNQSMQDIDRRFWARIEKFQPYKRGNGGRNSPLFLLDELNNTDKHRLLLIAGAALIDYRMNITEIDGMKVEKVRLYRGVEYKTGAKLLTFRFVTNKPSSYVKMNHQFTHRLVFSRKSGCPAIAGRPVHQTLVDMHMAVLDVLSEFDDIFFPDSSFADHSESATFY